MMPDLATRAVQADSYWATRLPQLRDSGSSLASFRGLYALAYRRWSALAHPGLMGLNRVVADLDAIGRRVDLESEDPESTGPFGLTCVVFALSFYVAAESLGWPTSSDVESIMTA